MRQRAQKRRVDARTIGRLDRGAKPETFAELKAFGVKLFQDMEAVVAALVITYSQDQIEGRTNKLKLVKRSMYGRGKFDFLG
jgi:transposase